MFFIKIQSKYVSSSEKIRILDSYELTPPIQYNFIECKSFNFVKLNLKDPESREKILSELEFETYGSNINDYSREVIMINYVSTVNTENNILIFNSEVFVLDRYNNILLNDICLEIVN